MKKLLAILFVLFGLGTSIYSREAVIIGKVIGAGMYFETERGVVFPLKSSNLTNELTELVGKQVRLLCDMSRETCSPRRYEIAPFATQTNLKDWTLKPIPKYVYHNKTAFNPTVTPDATKLFWTVLVEYGGKSTQKIWYSELDHHGFWKKGVQMGQPLNNETPSAVISALPGGNELFIFGSFLENKLFAQLKDRYKEQKKELVKSAKSLADLKIEYKKLKQDYKKELEKIQNHVPLYKSFKTATGWSNPNPIDFPGFYNLYRSKDNPMHQVFGGSSLSNSGRILIYSAKHKDSRGKLDLYVSHQTSSGEYGMGMNLGSIVNTSQEEMAPFLAPDGRTLYFSSNGHNGLSIYYTKRLGSGWEYWSKPVEISHKLKGVNFFSIPASGHWAYISKKGKLMMTFLPKQSKPNPVIVVKGRVVDDKGHPLGTKIEYESLVTYEKKGSTVSDPVTGKFSIVLPYGERYGFFAQKKGYLPVHKNIDIRKNANQYKEINVKIVLPEIKKGKEITMNNLFFESNKYYISDDSKPELDRLAQVLKEYPSIKVLIEGHTDNTGDARENQELSLNRAREVASYLQNKHNISSYRLDIVGKGHTKPIVSNDTPENRQKNRRVVFKIIE